jgi:hypothetical protein
MITTMSMSPSSVLRRRVIGFSREAQLSVVEVAGAVEVVGFLEVVGLVEVVGVVCCSR